MKRFLILVFLTAVLATACCTRLHRQADGQAAVAELSAIDSLMWSQPDSAFAMLLSFAESHEVDSLDSYNEHYFHLLLSELIYKNDYTQTNRNELLQAVGYYDSLVDAGGARLNEGIVFLDARAHYINGVGFYERDSVVPACEQYMKALERMEERFSEKELTGKKAQFMAIAYTHLMNLFSDQYLHEQAIGFGRKSLFYYNKYEATPWHVSWVMDEIGSHYHMIDQLDSADYYYTKAIVLLPDSNNITYRDVSAGRTLLDYKKGNNPNKAIEMLRHLVNQAETEQEYLARCLNISELFYHEKLYDSASYYLTKVFYKSSNIVSKKQAAEWLVEIGEVQGKDTRLYSEFLVPFANQEENKSAEKSNLTGLYNEFSVKALANQHRQKMKDSITWTAFFIGGLLLMVSVFVILYHKKKEKLELLERQFQKMGSLNEKPSTMEQFLNEPICQEIIFTTRGKTIKRSYVSLKYPELVLNESQLFHLALTVDRYFGPIENLLEDCGINLNPTLLNQCRLYLLGMDAKQIAVLLDKDYSSIKRYENKLKTLFKTQKDMVVFMRELVLKK